MSERANIKNLSVFLSGPMSGIENYNVAAFCEAHARLKALRPMRVYNPAISYLTSGDEYLHTGWMMISLKELLAGNNGYRYDVLIQLPGWQQSKGAILEGLVAEGCGIEIAQLSDVLGE